MYRRVSLLLGNSSLSEVMEAKPPKVDVRFQLVWLVCCLTIAVRVDRSPWRPAHY